MARPEAWQLEAANYPISQVCQTRFQDVDPNRHLNNVAFASLFEHARVRLNRELRPWQERPKNERSMVAAVTINYLREGSYPDDVNRLFRGQQDRHLQLCHFTGDVSA